MLPLRVLLLENLEILGKPGNIAKTVRRKKTQCVCSTSHIFVVVHALPGVGIPICNFIPALEWEISMILMLFPMCVPEPKPK